MRVAPEGLDLRDSDGRGPVLVHSLHGFMDAGEAGRLAVDHLLAALESEVLASFDTDLLVDHRARRPEMIYDRDHWESYQPHTLDLHLLRDGAGTPFLVLSGPEPDWHWERFGTAVRQLVDLFGVRLTVGVQGIPMGVPHTRPTSATAHATRPELIAGYEPVLDRMEVPGSVGALLELRLGEAEHDAAGVVVHVPHYLTRSEYPDAAVAALQHAGRISDLILPDQELRDCAERTRTEIEEQVAESDQVREVVHALEEQYDAFTRGQDRGNLLVEGQGALPTGEELGAAFEKYLAEQDADGGRTGEP